MKEMKNENVHIQALHHKLDVLVQIRPSETDYSFCEDSPLPQQDSAVYPDVGFTLTLRPPFFAPPPNGLVQTTACRLPVIKPGNTVLCNVFACLQPRSVSASRRISNFRAGRFATYSIRFLPKATFRDSVHLRHWIVLLLSVDIRSWTER